MGFGPYVRPRAEQQVHVRFRQGRTQSTDALPLLSRACPRALGDGIRFGTMLNIDSRLFTFASLLLGILGTLG